MEKVAIVLNPNSGHKLGEHLEPWLKLRLGEGAALHEIVPGVDAAAWARTQADAGFDRIIAMGGDGTFRSVAAAMIGSNVPLGLIPMGTNNNIASAIGLPLEPHEAAEIAFSGEPQWISAGKVSGYVFFEGAGIGLEADLWPVGEALVRHRFGEVLEAPLKIATDRSYDLAIELDPPKSRQSVRAFTMTISNTSQTGAHLVLAPGVDIRDPMLYLSIYHDLGRLKLLASGPALHKGHKGHGYTVSRYPFMRLKVECDHHCHVHADGTLIGTLPIEVVSIPQAVRVPMPKTVAPLRESVQPAEAR